MINIQNRNHDIYGQHKELVHEACMTIVGDRNRADILVNRIFEQAYKDRFRSNIYLAKKQLLGITVEHLSGLRQGENNNLSSRQRTGDSYRKVRHHGYYKHTVIEQIIALLGNKYKTPFSSIVDLLELRGSYNDYEYFNLKRIND